MAGTVDITINLQLYKAEVLRGFRSFLNVDRPEHHIVELNAQRKKEWRKEVDDPPPPLPPSSSPLPLPTPTEVGNMCSTRPMILLPGKIGRGSYMGFFFPSYTILS